MCVRVEGTYDVHERVLRVVDHDGLCDYHEETEDQREHREDAVSLDLFLVVGLWPQDHLVKLRQLVGVLKVSVHVGFVKVDWGLDKGVHLVEEGVPPGLLPLD